MVQTVNSCNKLRLMSGLTGIQLSTSGAKFVPLIFYHLHSNTQDIYYLNKVKNHETIELERSMD
jgi:hypothetical protein